MRIRLIDAVRVVSLADGVSYLVLLGIAVPLKHLAEWSLAVQVVGPIHGALFVALIVFLVLSAVPWSLKAKLMLAAIVPFAPWLMDAKLRDVKESMIDQGP